MKDFVCLFNLEDLYFKKKSNYKVVLNENY